MDEAKKIAVVGPGAMGLMIAARLIEAGRDVVLLGRDAEAVEAINREGIILEDGEGERAVPAKAFLRPEDAGPAVLAVFMVKSYDTGGAARGLKKLLKEGGSVLTLQNGLGNAEIIAEHVGGDALLAGATGEGATRTGKNRVFHAGRGETVLGPLSPGPESLARAEDAARILGLAGFNCRIAEGVEPVLWQKLIVNVAINPITALTGMRNGCIIEDGSLHELMEAVAREAARVARARGVDLGPGDQAQRVREVCERTAKNVSSMLADFRAGRPTEIEAIAGAILKEAETLEMDAPFIRALYLLVKAKENINGLDC